MTTSRDKSSNGNNEQDPADRQAWAKVREEAARVKSEQEIRAKAEQDARLKAEQDARAKAEQEARAKAEQEARAKAEQDSRAKAKQEAVSVHVIAAEAIDYSRRSLENGSAFVAKLLGARSLESAIQIRSEYAKTSYEDFVAYATKIRALQARLVAKAFKPRSFGAR